MDPTFIVVFWIAQARRSCCLAFWSIFSQISALTRGTINLSQFSGLGYFSNFSFSLTSLSLDDHRLLTISGSCWFMSGPLSSSWAKCCEISHNRASRSSRAHGAPVTPSIAELAGFGWVEELFYIAVQILAGSMMLCSSFSTFLPLLRHDPCLCLLVVFIMPR